MWHALTRWLTVRPRRGVARGPTPHFASATFAHGYCLLSSGPNNHCATRGSAKPQRTPIPQRISALTTSFASGDTHKCSALLNHRKATTHAGGKVLGGITKQIAVAGPEVKQTTPKPRADVTTVRDARPASAAALLPLLTAAQYGTAYGAMAWRRVTHMRCRACRRCWPYGSAVSDHARHDCLALPRQQEMCGLLVLRKAPGILGTKGLPRVVLCVASRRRPSLTRAPTAYGSLCPLWLPGSRRTRSDIA